MKKFFTFIALALSVNGAFAQETYQPFADGALKAEFANATAGTDGDIVVTLNATDNMELTVRSSRTPEVSPTAGLNNTNWDTWKDAALSYDGGPGDLADGATFPTLRGTGVPYISFTGVEQTKDDEPLGTYYPSNESWVYYDPEAPAIPASGLLYKFVPKVDGTLKAGFWVNKGTRYFYVACESGGTVTNVSYTREGYVNGQNGIDEYGESDGKKRYITATEMDEISASPYLAGGGNQPAWIYVTFSVEAGKSYYCFNHNAQAGFNGYEFTTTTGISDIAAGKTASDRAFNLAGQQVGKGFRGIVVKNGKKFIQ